MMVKVITYGTYDLLHSIKLLWQKYVWGNRQKIWLWNITIKKYIIK